MKKDPTQKSIHTVLDIVESFDKNSRSLLNDANLCEGTICVDSTNRAHLTSKTCIESLQKALESSAAAVSLAKHKKQAQKRKDYSEAAAEKRRLLDLGSAGTARRVILNANRRAWRELQKFQASLQLGRLLDYVNLDGNALPDSSEDECDIHEMNWDN